MSESGEQRARVQDVIRGSVESDAEFVVRQLYRLVCDANRFNEAGAVVTGLENAWRDTARGAGLSEDAAEAAWHDLTRRYSEPGRAYHTLTHIAAMLAVVEEF